MNSGPSGLKRRKFLAAAAASLAMATGCRRESSPWRFFTVQEAATMDAIAERLIPADHDPGAHDAAVVDYIDRQLTRHYRKHQATYRNGLAEMEARARTASGKPFAELDGTTQDTLLAAFEKGPVADKQVFELWLAHTIQGFYGSPRHGGNRDAVSWRMLGVPTIPVRGRQAYVAGKES